jgi:hypothetical protein
LEIEQDSSDGSISWCDGKKMEEIMLCISNKPIPSPTRDHFKSEIIKNIEMCLKEDETTIEISRMFATVVYNRCLKDFYDR